MIQRALAVVFLFFIVSALVQCAKRGNPTGGPKDETPPELLKAEPENMSVNFNTNTIKLYFDEYVKLEKLQEQLIVSPPLKYLPLISPQGGASKVVEITIKDTLRENTTYTFNFGQSIVDNNEGNAYPYLNYVFSTGTYIDSLELTGVIRDAFEKKADNFVSVMLYEIDTAYTDSTVFKRPPNYITNTLDSAIIFKIGNIKKGKYALFAIKDEAKNNVFDQNTDKIGYVTDTVTMPTDSTYLLTMFKEIPSYGISVPNFAAKNKIVFGYYGTGKDISIAPLHPLPDTVRTTILKEPGKDTLNYWFTPFKADSILFTVRNETLSQIDTFNVKTRKVGIDSMILEPNFNGSLDFNKSFQIGSNTPLLSIDSTLISIMDKDSLDVGFTVALDSLENKVDFDFEAVPEQSYAVQLLPGAIQDFFNTVNDSTEYNLSTKSLADYGNLTVQLEGAVRFPLIIQLITENGELEQEKYATDTSAFEFSTIDPGKYLIRVIDDTNGNQQWDTGSFLRRLQPEKVSYYPTVLEVRANWELIETFRLLD